MPYIEKASRIDVLVEGARSPGELNFQLSAVIISYTKQKGLSYQTINDCLGALAGAQAEYYRRVAVPFEEDAIRRNGDIYE